MPRPRVVDAGVATNDRAERDRRDVLAGQQPLGVVDELRRVQLDRETLPVRHFERGDNGLDPRIASPGPIVAASSAGSAGKHQCHDRQRAPNRARARVCHCRRLGTLTTTISTCVGAPWVTTGTVVSETIHSSPSTSMRTRTLSRARSSNAARSTESSNG
jgi:hypothetical protein